jgi:hypothetical protein
MSDDGCGCLVALAVIGAIAYGAWTYFGTPTPQSQDVPGTARPVPPRVPEPVVDGRTDDGSPLVDLQESEDNEQSCAIIRRMPVNSSMIRSVGYCPAQRTLEIEFERGTVYRYWGVSQGTYDAFMAAPSKGRFFNRAIRSQPYGYTRVR